MKTLSTLAIKGNRWIGIALMMVACSCCFAQSQNQLLAKQILSSKSYKSIKERALIVVKSGFNAGDGYGEVWIRDYNTFIELSAEVASPEALKENLLVFFHLQGVDGNIADGFIPVDKTGGGYTYIYSKTEPRYAGHKNTVETDQESSLIQAVYKYIHATKDSSVLSLMIDNKSVSVRMEMALQFLMENRFSKEYGLIYGATTADWGDVQPEHNWGVYLTDDTHYAIDIYDNAMLLIALDNFIAMIPSAQSKWQSVRNSIAQKTMEYLWDKKERKFIPHRYISDSPFPKTFDENKIYYHGGTAVAIEAGLLDNKDIKASLAKMIANVKASGAPTIGLTLYPTYPENFFANKGMYPYGYQNGGDWDWFGGRMIQQLVQHGYIKEAIDQLQPMLDRAEKNNGFFEWYSLTNEPKGSGTFRGSAGVLYNAIERLEIWAKENR